MPAGTPNRFEPYVPRLALEWLQHHPDERMLALDGSLISLDISGFTALSERLATKGKVGAEELILLISGVFEGLIGIAHRHGGDVLKFRGDALLLLFSGNDHAVRACRAASQMQWFIETAGSTQSSVGSVTLGMSTGVYSGLCHFYVIGSSHRELVVTGPATSATAQLEDAAGSGEILLSAATAAAVEPAWLGEERDGSRLLARVEEEDALAHAATVTPAGVDASEFIPAPVRAQLEWGAGEGEHRQVTAAFVKFSGTDGLLATEGQEAVLERLAALGTIVGEQCDRLGITWLESDIDVDGGKLYLTAGAPASRGGDEERMLRALRAILDSDPPLAIRAGVNRGPAFAGDVGASMRRSYVVTGDTANLAARLTGRAQPGQLLATGDVLERSRTTFETESQPFLVKGKERSITAYGVGAVAGAREEEPVTALPLVGREAELEVLSAAVDGARLRTSQLVELVGQPGIGKSRLVEELKTRSIGFQQLLARCESYESSTPYFAFRSLLRPLAGITPTQSAAEAGAQLQPWVEAVLPDLAPWLPLLAIPFDATVPPTPETESIDPTFRRDRLHESVERFLERVLMMPTLLVIEDAHWIDDASQFLLGHLAGAAPRPWLLCVTRRPEGPSFVNGAGSLLALAPLPPEASARLALAAADDLALSEDALTTLAERSGGNPLFVTELIAASRRGDSLEALPESVETLITTRIDTLDPGDRMLLRYASVIGPSFDLDLLREILAEQPVDVDDLGRWERLSEFVDRVDGDELRFRHDLFRAVAYEALAVRRRRDVHGRVAEAIERRAGENVEESAAVLSLHFFAAARYEEAWRYAVVAADDARAKYANVVAAELYDRALASAERLPDLDPAEIARVAEQLGDVAELFAAYDRAAAAYAQARGLLQGDPLALTRLTLKEGVLREREARYNDAIDWYERGLARLEQADLGDEGRRIKIDLQLAYAGVRYRQGRHDESLKLSKPAAADAESLGYTRALAHACSLVDVASTAAGRPELEYRERALPLYEEVGDLLGYANALNNRGIDAYYEARWDEAIDYYRRSGAESARAGDVVNAARARNNEAEILSDQGRLAEAEALFTEALRVWRAGNYVVGVSLATSNLGRAAARGGRFGEAERLLRDALFGFEAIGAESFVLETQARLVERFVLEGHYRDAQELARATLERARRGEAGALLEAMLERLAGYALVQARTPADAREHFERSLASARGADAEFEIALTLRALADIGAATEEQAAESAEILERLGVVSLPRIPLP